MNGSQPSLSPTADAAEPALARTADLAGLEPFKDIRHRWPVWLGMALSLLMVAGLAKELFDQGLVGLSRTLPQNPLFYIAFFVAYIASPLFDFLIFRRLWDLTAKGFAALVRKRIANDVVFGYSGDAYFYAWARAKMKMVVAPFGAVKDVSILSAVAGNVITLAMLAFVLPLGKDLMTGHQFRVLAGSTAIIFATSLGFLLFSSRVFSLRRARLWWIFRMHCGRILLGTVASAFAWHFALPEVSLFMWTFLAAARLLASRLPLVPNKDLLFANFAIMLIGEGQAISDMIAFAAALTLLLHVVLAGFFSLQALMGKG
ncbi:hypothetical protein [Stakelama marina]|uniref:Uncharacterized protein n=1 Tax=Stakelama marina TaxID=2826939 RepID=A0A8T4IDJ5_9SPHN|nr:hypothetical protein [Stakelama marina]MBR0552481.1 hypothetical protein [Stakelama marina]